MKLAAVRKFALALPEVTEEPHFHLSSFRVRGKIFVTVPPEETHLHVFVDETQREPALARNPTFIEKLWWGGKVRGLRVALADADPAVVKALVRAAWEAKAPRARGQPAPRSKARGASGRARRG
jgi:hypothetical protein